MAEGKPLALRRQKSKAPARARKFQSVAEVLVDTKAYHLVEPFTYGIPDDLIGDLKIGSQVRVPFQDELLDGLVVEIRSNSDYMAKPIHSLQKSKSLGEGYLKFLQEIAERYGVRLIDLLRFVPEIPEPCGSIIEDGGNSKRKISYLATTKDPYLVAISELAKRRDQALVTTPTDREAVHVFELLEAAGEPAFLVRSNASIGERRRILQLASMNKRSVIVGTRGAILAPIEVSLIVVLGELSSLYWEPRAPYWNLRDLALLRNVGMNSELVFIGNAPSLEISRLIDAKYINFKADGKSSRNRKFTFAPDTYHQTIREGIKNGSVLISVIDKTYSSAFLCSKCRSVPRCKCGGRFMASEKEMVLCNLCRVEVTEWKCEECSGRTKFFLRRGASRIKEEIGKAFPTTAILLATSENRDPSPVDGSIIIATPGMEPLGVQYGAIVLLDGEGALARNGLRSEEVLRDNWLRLISLGRDDARVFSSLPRSHSISQTILLGNPLPAIRTEMSERKSLDLPPYRRLVTVSGSEADLNNLRAELNNNPSLMLSGIIEGKVVIRVTHEGAPQFIKSLYALQRYRSASRRRMFNIAIDPFEI